MTTIAPFPHEYSVSYADGYLANKPRPSIPAGTPPQFGGSENVWSPEELLVGAVLLCVKTTFDAYARAASLEVRAWRGSATGFLQKAAGGPAFSSIKLSVQLTVPVGAEDRTRELLVSAERDCIISRAITAPVELEASITSD